MKRRESIKDTVISGSALVLGRNTSAGAIGEGLPAADLVIPVAMPATPSNQPRLPELKPARWLWYPSEQVAQSPVVSDSAVRIQD